MLNDNYTEKLQSLKGIMNIKIHLLPVLPGCGKTYMSCAFGMEACQQYYKTKFVRLPDLLIDLQIAKDEGNNLKTRRKYTNPDLLIIDEWLFLKPTADLLFILSSLITLA